MEQEQKVMAAQVNREVLRQEIKEKYTGVAMEPEAGFHFHTGRPLAKMLDYDDADLDWLPAATLESFAGTGNPFAMGRLAAGETVLDMGCGAGVDTLIAARQVGPSGRVIAVDMTDAMLHKTKAGAAMAGLGNVDARLGFAEALPAEDASIDVLISNGVVNLCPDKEAVMREVFRVLKPSGRLQIADIIVHKEVPQDAKDDIELWSG
jgi:SAM-dependent methyltransferase